MDTGIEIKPGNVLLSHSLATIVPSTSKGLTAVFGMGTGVAPSAKLPETPAVRGNVIRGHNTSYPKKTIM